MLTPRDLPAIDKLMSSPELTAAATSYGSETVKAALRDLQASWRASGSLPDWATEPKAYAREIATRLNQQRYQAVINLTGTIIHTNLGRAPLSDEVFDEVPLGMTDFLQQVKARQSLEGELKRTISQLEQVDDVRLHVVQPKPSLFTAEQHPATASIMLTLRQNSSWPLSS